MRRHRNAKIVATIGPASSSSESLMSLFLAGVDTFRLNFSHGTHAEHARVHAAIRAIEASTGRPIAILQDLQGPKIRLGSINGGSILVRAREKIRFILSEAANIPNAIPLPHPEIFTAVAPDQDLLIDDGRIRARVIKAGSDTIEAEIIVGGAIASRKGVNLPGTGLNLSPLTAKDRADLALGLELGVDWVAVSFIQRPEDLVEARALIGGQAALLAKVEKPGALQHIEDIVNLADAVMIARGDLGVEIPHEDVPGRQKELVRLCRKAGKPVIVATQMLESMVAAPTPTRAEASDVATAIYDGADAVMLSAESASGRYPVEAVQFMDRIIRGTEGHKLYRSILAASEPGIEQNVSHAVSAAAAELAGAIEASTIVAFTASGATASRIARKRPAVSILAITPHQAIARRLALLWGVHSVLSEDIRSYEGMIEEATRRSLTEDFTREDDFIVVVAGIPFAQAGTTNNLRVLRVEAS